MKDYSHVQNQSNQGNNKRGSKFQNVSKLQLIFGLIVLLLISLFFVKQRLNFIRIEKSLRKLRVERSKLDSEILPLQLEDRLLKNYEYIEKTARDKFHLAPPKPSQIKRIVVKK